MRNLDVSLLRTFLIVADSGSMSTAARRQHFTQSAVSQQVQRLETLLGQALLNRGKSGITLTALGERLYPQFSNLVALNDEIMAQACADDIDGVVRLGVPHDLLDVHLPSILTKFSAQFPNVQIVLVPGASGELIRAMQDREMDIALTEEPAKQAMGDVLRVESLIWVGKHGGDAWRRRPLPVCLVSASCIFRSPMADALAGEGIAWRNTIDFPSLEATLSMVDDDSAVTVLLSSTVPPHLDRLDTHHGLPALPLFAITLHAHKHSVSKACDAMDAVLRSAF